MADEQKPKAGWLERRRDAKRVKREKRAKRIAEQRQHDGAGAEHATRGWESSSGPGPG
jgi:hypothetical protein